MNAIKELWHGNIQPQEDSRTNTKEMKELIGYIARHHEELEKDFTDEQKEIFEKFQDCRASTQRSQKRQSSNTPSSSVRGSLWIYREIQKDNR